MHSIENKFNLLNEDFKREVSGFVDYLISKRSSKVNRPPKTFDFSWEGCLSDEKEKYSSVELQH